MTDSQKTIPCHTHSITNGTKRLEMRHPRRYRPCNTLSSPQANLPSDSYTILSAVFFVFSVVVVPSANQYWQVVHRLLRPSQTRYHPSTDLKRPESIVIPVEPNTEISPWRLCNPPRAHCRIESRYWRATVSNRLFWQYRCWIELRPLERRIFRCRRIDGIDVAVADVVVDWARCIVYHGHDWWYRHEMDEEVSANLTESMIYLPFESILVRRHSPHRKLYM